LDALEFDGLVANHDQIRVPPDVAGQIPEGSVVRLILLLTSGEGDGWRRLSRDGFSAAFSEEDAVYEKLDDGSARR
jgi:hypothetical protein